MDNEKKWKENERNENARLTIHAQPISITPKEIIKNEYIAKEKLIKNFEKLLKKLPSSIINRVEAGIGFDGADDGYTAILTRNYIPLKKKSAYIGWGDINIFDKLLVGESTNLEEEKEKRRRSIWKLLYNRLAIEPVSDIIEKISQGKSYRLVKEILGKALFNIEIDEKSLEEIRYQLFPEDKKEYRDYVTSKSIILTLKEVVEKRKILDKDINVIGYLLFLHDESKTWKEDPRNYENYNGFNKAIAYFKNFVENKKDKKIIIEKLIPEKIKEYRDEKEFFFILLSSLDEAKKCKKSLEILVDEGIIDRVYITPVEAEKGYPVKVY